MSDDVEHFLSFTGEAAIQVCCPFSNWLLVFLLLSLESSLLDLSFANITSVVFLKTINF